MRSDKIAFLCQFADIDGEHFAGLAANFNEFFDRVILFESMTGPTLVAGSSAGPIFKLRVASISRAMNPS